MNPTYEQLSARVHELTQGVTDLQAMVWGTDKSDPQFNRLDEARSLSERLLKNDDAFQFGAVKHKGHIYCPTGKWGNRRVDGMMGREMRTPEDARIWQYRDGTIAED